MNEFQAKAQQFKDDFLANNRQIYWQPEHVGPGRFGKFLESNVDWALSRERFWGTPLPIWVCEKTGYMEAVSSYAELVEKPDVKGLEVWQQAKAADPKLSDHLRVHKPYIDAITYRSPKDATSRMRRVPEVIDVWFDAGCMPFAQWGYPHRPESDAKFKQNFPADFISEALDQTRGWFYAQLAISTLLFRDAKVPHPFKNCVCLGLLLGEDGEKDENTAYLYMEFMKPETKNYMTIGLGLKAQRGKSLQSWGFALTDGRRIGQDFYLYKNLGEKIPL
jgi:isoleucyl-tRNA synthetase